MKIIYKSENDAVEFDINRYLKSLNRYGKVSEEQIKKGLESFNYDPLHVSCLVELGVKLLPDEDSARAYFEDHQIDNADFERLRRITGYLVGTLARWNTAKQEEEKARVKHTVSGFDHQAGQYSPEEKNRIEEIKLENSVMSQF